MRILTVLAIVFALYSNTDAKIESKYVTIGNLQTTIHGETLFSTDIQDDRKDTDFLWCQVRDMNKEVKISDSAQFHRDTDKKTINADIAKDGKAYMYFGKSSAEYAGKWRCQIKDPEGVVIFGNMFAYSRPIFKNNDSWPLVKSDKEEALAVGPAVHASFGRPAIVRCPVLGYPRPSVEWFKNNDPIEWSERITYNHTSGVLQIKDATEEDSGVYRCVARNEFPVVIDGPNQEFVSSLDQELRVGDAYGWMLPLAIIIIILLLLVLIIFTCQRCTKYKAANYNVAERERALHNDQVPLKNSV